MNDIIAEQLHLHGAFLLTSSCLLYTKVCVNELLVTAGSLRPWGEAGMALTSGPATFQMHNFSQVTLSAFPPMGKLRAIAALLCGQQRGLKCRPGGKTPSPHLPWRRSSVQFGRLHVPFDYQQACL